MSLVTDKWFHTKKENKSFVCRECSNDCFWMSFAMNICDDCYMEKYHGDGR